MNLENSASLTFMLAIYAFFGAPGLRLLARKAAMAGESHLEFGGDIGWVLRFG
jgi:hypothetical protein